MNLKPASALGRSLDFMVQRSGGPKQGFDFSTGTYDFEFYAPFIEEFREFSQQISHSRAVNPMI